MSEESHSRDQPSSAPPTTPGPRPQREPFNVPGFVGLILSAAGFTGFCMSPLFLLGTIGMGVSIFGLFRTPRTIAIVGVVIGLAATILGAIILMAEPPASPEVVPPP